MPRHHGGQPVWYPCTPAPQYSCWQPQPSNLGTLALPACQQAVAPSPVVRPPSNQSDLEYYRQWYLNYHLGGSSFSSLTNQIRNNLRGYSWGSYDEISLVRHTTASSMTSALQGVNLYASNQNSIVTNFNSAITFTVPAGTPGIGLTTFRYGNDGQQRCTYTMHNHHLSGTPRQEVSDLYEVHVQRINGQDHYTIALGHNFIGGLQITVNGRSYFVLSHQLPATPAQSPQQAVPGPQTIPSQPSPQILSPQGAINQLQSMFPSSTGHGNQNYMNGAQILSPQGAINQFQSMFPSSAGSGNKNNTNGGPANGSPTPQSKSLPYKSTLPK